MTKLPSASYIFIDRRKTGSGKSVPNRQRLLRRIKAAIRAAKPQDLADGGVKNISTPGGSINPVKVTREVLHEPTFHYEPSTGEYEIVLIGNTDFERGDDFPIGSDDEEGQGTGGPGEGGEDDFVVNISREEFLDVFFEDCALPDLRENHQKEIPQYTPQHAGFQTNGNPSQLSVKRSFKNAFARKRVLSTPVHEELKELEAEYAALMVQLAGDNLTGDDEANLHAKMQEIELLISELRSKLENIPFFEDLDLRYTKKDKIQVKAAQAVFMMIMDISGSMDRDKKRMARKFFSLQYAFILRKYPHTDLVFIAHTDSAKEMSEHEFFTTRENGGTIVSPAYELALQIIKTRYNTHETNIYLSQASDGDNWDSDNAQIIPALEDSGLLARIRHMSYVQVGMSYAGSFYGTSLWDVLKSIANTTKKISMDKIMDDGEIFDVFRKMYRKQPTKQA